MDIVGLALVVYAVAMVIGYVANRYVRLPWMFSIVILGMVFAATGWFHETLEGPDFALLSRLGMLLFLFVIGLELNLKEIRHLGAYIVGGDILLTLTEGTVLGLFFYTLFPEMVGGSLLIALVCGVAFGTVGEVVLLAILKEFKMENTRFGQLALGIGVFDDIFEILALAVVVALPSMLGSTGSVGAWRISGAIILTLAGLIVATVLCGLLGRYARALLRRLDPDSFVLPFALFSIAFLFVYFGSMRFEDLAVVAAIFAGIAAKQLLPEPAIQRYQRPVTFVANIFLGPFFFLGLGAKMSFTALLSNTWLVIAVVLIALSVRIALSYLLFRRLLGKRESVVMGIGLTSKFSTSVITESLLLSAGLITPALYSVLMGAFIVLKPIIVTGFARGLAAMPSPEPAVATKPAASKESTS